MSFGQSRTKEKISKDFIINKLKAIRNITKKSFIFFRFKTDLNQHMDHSYNISMYTSVENSNLK